MRRLTNSGAEAFPLLIDFGAIDDLLVADVLSSVSRATANFDLDEDEH